MIIQDTEGKWEVTDIVEISRTQDLIKLKCELWQPTIRAKESVRFLSLSSMEEKESTEKIRREVPCKFKPFENDSDEAYIKGEVYIKDDEDGILILRIEDDGSYDIFLGKHKNDYMCSLKAPEKFKSFVFSEDEKIVVTYGEDYIRKWKHRTYFRENFVKMAKIYPDGRIRVSSILSKKRLQGRRC